LRVLALGGAGEYGRHAARILASSSLVSGIVIAGRNLEAAQNCAKDIGEKATATSIDVSDRDKLVALARDCDIIVNTTGPEYETVLKVLEAAISSGTNYCDIGGDGPTTEAAL
jgi:saccharopine dehydrogenase-like NADP-dependent oxidoreductase